jgi:hypothetical protein
VWEALLKRIDGSSSEEAVVTFEGTAILTPRWEIWTIYLLKSQADLFMIIFCMLYSKSKKIFGHAEDDTRLSFIFHFSGFKHKLVILKSNIAALSASLFCQRLCLFCILLHALLLCSSYCFLLMLNMKVIVWHDCAWQSNNPHTIVVVTLDPPIRKGQTLYPHIVIQVMC